MLIELSNLQIILLNCLGIPGVHLGISFACEKLPRKIFERPSQITSPTPDHFYRKVFQIHRWKHHLPDAAPWLNGFPKATLASTEAPYLRTFIAETRRGELAHWLQWIVISFFVAWNPFPANLVILAYALIMNLPCILNLRHTRSRMISLLARKVSSSR